MPRFCTELGWVCALVCCAGFGVYQLVVTGDTCAGLSYAVVPCLCNWLVGAANVLVPCAIVSLHQTKGPFFGVIGAKALAYSLAARFAVDFAMNDLRTQLMLVDLLATSLLCALTVAAARGSTEPGRQAEYAAVTDTVRD
jgi:hypothetical protein